MKKKSLLAGIPAWALAMFTLFGVTFITIALGEGLGPYLKINENMGEALAYIFHGMAISICCYFIVKRYPAGIWYVPLICNLTVIISAIGEPNFWISSSMWIPMCGGFILSILASYMGAMKGKSDAVAHNH